MKKPEVLTYHDFRSYMRDFYEFRKSTQPGFSFAAWNKRAGFKSRSFLRLVMLGKREPSINSVIAIAKALELNQSESRYFGLLVQFAQASGVEDRESLLKQILTQSRSRRGRQVKNSYLYLSRHQTPIVVSYLILKDVDRTIVGTARALGLQEGMVKEIIEVLCQLKIASAVGDSDQWQVEAPEVHVMNEFGNLAIQCFHRKSLETAKLAIENPPEERAFESITLALTNDQYIQCLSEVRSFTDQLLARYKSSTGHDRKIHQLNIQLIPVSERLIRSKVVHPERVPGSQLSGKKMIEVSV